MRTGKLTTWLLRGTYPRLYLPIALIILLVTGVRYHYLLEAETDELQGRAQSELQRTGDYLLPRLAALPVSSDMADAVLGEAASRFSPSVQSLVWHVAGQATFSANSEEPRARAPVWFSKWLGIGSNVKQFAQPLPGGATGRLTVKLHAAPLVDSAWNTVMVQARISALNIFTILFLLTLLLRANARMLERLAEATNSFRQGHLETRMQETGTLESRAMAATFNDMAGKIQSLVLSLRETQRLQSEQLHFTRQLIDAMPLPVFVRNVDGVFLEVNRAARALFADTPWGARSVGNTFESFPVQLQHGRSTQLAQAQNNVILVQPPHQQPRYMAYHEAPFTSANGRIAGTVGTLVDVTDCKQAEEALRVEKERTEITLASIGDGVITTDASGRVDSMNEAAQVMTGYTVGQAIGRPLEEVFRLHEEPSGFGASMTAPLETQPGVLQQANYEMLIHRSGERYAIEYTASAIRTHDDYAPAGCVLVFRNVTETRNLRHQISWHARHDPLTGLYNRAALAERLTHALFVARNEARPLAVCMLDLDRFQAINDAHGNRVGDRLLKETARRLEAFVRPGDAAARMGGDEFVLLLGQDHDAGSLHDRLDELLQQLSAPYAIGDRTVHTTASIGVALFPADNANPDTLLRHADQAMCRAKSLGRNQVHVFDVEHDHAVQTQHTRQARVAQALRAGELVLYYQPKVNLRTGEVLGLEALLRWQHPTQGLLGPQHILAAIDDPELDAELGEWVLRQALAQTRHWAEAGMPWDISVNISAAHFHRPGFVDRLQEILQAFPEVSPQRLELEILESTALEDMELMRNLMQSCQSLGVRFALDDFGTGYSSLSYLKRLPAETIKIDQSFVRGILEDGDDLTLVNAIVALAAAFGRHVVAEGAETPEQCARLLALGCERAQGFGIGRPMPAQAVLAWAQEHAGSPSQPKAGPARQSATMA